MRKLILVTSLALVVAGPARADRPFQKGAVAAAHPLGSAAGREMLEQGGNAVDAAVAAAFAMAVVGPYHSGLGGGGFAVVHLSEKKLTTTLDFREVAPAAATRDMYVRDGKPVGALSTDGALSVAVPGAVKGYLELLEKYGKLSRAKVLAPAIRAAKNGFAVSPKYRVIAEERTACLSANADAARIFLRPGADGKPGVPEVGVLIKQPELAKTLEALVKSGASSFYAGATAKAVADTVRSAGGILTEADLKAYATRPRAPLWGEYRGHRIATMGPPSAGGLAVIQVLGVLERHGPKGLPSREVDVIHTYVEALRRAYVDRAKFLGDPAFVKIPLEKLSSPDALDAMNKSIDPKKATPSLSLLNLDPPSDKKHTTHISVVDAAGNAVALTTTINYYFGSCLVAKGTGVMLNDEMDDFANQPGTPNKYGLVTGEANAIAPGKVPLSSMSPTLVFQKDRPNDVFLAVGSPGGSTIPTTVMQVISNVVDGPLNVTQAVGLGRIHHQYQPDVIRVDRTALDPATVTALEAMGHKVERVEGWGDAEAVRVDPMTGLRSAASDPRNEGAAAGQD